MDRYVMNVKSRNEIPVGSMILKDFNTIHYCDSYYIKNQTSDRLDKITTDVFRTPKWADLLMGIRNNIVQVVGLKGGGYKNNTHLPVKPFHRIIC